MIDFPYPLGAGSIYTETWESMVTNPNGGDRSKVYAYGNWRYEQKFIHKFNRRYARLGYNDSAQWSLRGNNPLSQSYYNLCVTSSFTNWIGSEPYYRLNQPLEVTAQNMYWIQREFAEYLGEPNFPAGSNAALADMFVEREWAESYLWLETLEEFKYWLRTQGPVIMECAWRSGMWQTDDAYFLNLSGNQISKHSILCYAFNNRTGIYSFLNSWGPDWGNRGRFKMREADVEYFFFKDRPDPKYSPIGRALGMIKSSKFPETLGTAISPYVRDG